MSDYANMEFQSKKKSVGVAYFLLFLFGVLGVHRLYAGNIVSGLLMLPVFLFGIIWLFALQSWYMFAFSLLWWAADWILTAGMIRDANLKIMNKIKEQAGTF